MNPWLLAFLGVDILIRLITVVYVPQRRTPAAARTWLLLILLLPIPGLLAYMAFGRMVRPRRLAALYLRLGRRLESAKLQWREAATVEAVSLPEHSAAVALAQRLGGFPAQDGHAVQLISAYGEALARLEADIDAARTHVHLLYYIFAPDQVGERIVAALVRAAGRGVACRVLMDAVGSRAGLIGLAPRLTAAGVEVTAVLPVGMWRRKTGRLDLRNHRKMAVIDGLVAYVGSQNLVASSCGRGLETEDLVVRLTGPAVSALQVVFLADRYAELEQPLPTTGLFPRPAGGASSIVQVLPSGPAYGQANFKQVAQTLIHAARKRICLTTPYFIPDEPFLECLQMAASRGVEVVVILSRHGDNRLVSWAQRSFYAQLLDEGTRLHLYEPAFLHAKHLSIDDEVAVIGSANLDIRSFWLNNEISLLIFDGAVARALHAVEEGYLARSTALTAAAWRRRGWLNQIAQNIARLADAVL